jgi:tetratricopeptide (TPR) repeat protein
MGNYSLGIGILKALAQGLEGKFKDHLGRAQEIDAGFLNGGVENAWGRFYFKLPWPKYDPGQSERHLLAALRINPDNVRGRVYLAELYEREHHPREARAQLERALARPPGQYDGPEERRYQKRARAILAQLQ